MGFFVYFFLQLLQLFRMMLQRFFAVKLHECLVDYETSLTFHQHWGGEDDLLYSTNKYHGVKLVKESFSRGLRFREHSFWNLGFSHKVLPSSHLLTGTLMNCSTSSRWIHTADIMISVWFEWIHSRIPHFSVLSHWGSTALAPIKNWSIHGCFAICQLFLQSAEQCVLLSILPESLCYISSSR